MKTHHRKTSRNARLLAPRHDHGLFQAARHLRRPTSNPHLDAAAVVDGLPLAIDAVCQWPIEADTRQLGNDDWLRVCFYRMMRDIYWDLGTEDVAEQVFDEFLRDWKFM